MSEPPPLSGTHKLFGALVARGVRNRLEELRGDPLEKPLTDDQLDRLGPIVAGTVVTVLHAIDTPSIVSSMYLEAIQPPPETWDQPELLDDYVYLWREMAGPDTNCRHCDLPIIQTGPRRWIHRTPDGAVVGCRAASYTAAGGWNDDLARHWKARPA